MEQVLLTSAYLGPLNYYGKMLMADQVLIEQYDSYHKQTWRNRCRIMAANGPLDLSVPVVKKSGQKMLMKEVEIDYSTRWQANHWRSLLAAYASSPFFEFYEDDFRPFYEKKWSFLIDFNQEINACVCNLLELPVPLGLSDSFVVPEERPGDFRFNISPKSSHEADPLFQPVEYYQIFDEKYGFVPNMSIVDLLFNTGPEALLVLEESVKANG
ncbi:WbqC family protein [Roseimarinus sediminis]|uniref:WbqC family protein n=1 Tax=Roseimarinus sediminis TaxID=1610899 RepID=UPI003D190F8A